MCACKMIMNDCLSVCTMYRMGMAITYSIEKAYLNHAVAFRKLDEITAQLRQFLLSISRETMKDECLRVFHVPLWDLFNLDTVKIQTPSANSDVKPAFSNNVSPQVLFSFKRHFIVQPKELNQRNRSSPWRQETIKSAHIGQKETVVRNDVKQGRGRTHNCVFYDLCTRLCKKKSKQSRRHGVRRNTHDNKNTNPERGGDRSNYSTHSLDDSKTPPSLTAKRISSSADTSLSILDKFD